MANVKASALPLITPTSDDRVLLVDSPGGTPSSKIADLASVKTLFAIPSGALASKNTVGNADHDAASIGTDKLATVRDMSFTDSSTSGSANKIPLVSGGNLDVSVPVMNASGLYVQKNEASFKTAMNLTNQNIIDGISTILGTAWQGGGSSNTVPATFGTGDWTVVDPATDNDITINYNTLPANGGSAITALDYRLDGGSAVTVSGTGTGARTVSGLTNGQTYTVEIRAVNAVGAGAWSASKTVVPSTAGYTPVFVSTNSGASTFSVPANQFGSDHAKLTFALNANRTNSTGSKDIFAFPGRSIIQQSGANMTIYIASITNSTLYQSTFSLGTGAHAFAVSIDLTIPSVEIRRDGTLLTVTGDPATGIQETLAPTIGTIDWSNGSSGVLFFNAGSAVFGGSVADMYFESGVARATSLFFSGTNPTRWDNIGTPQIAPGHGRSAANWNSGLHDGTSTVTASGWT